MDLLEEQAHLRPQMAAILIGQQQKGLEMLTARGILVKVNSVLIPGVNDRHLKKVSRVESQGAFMHNVMPLIAEAGTRHFGVMGQRSPSPRRGLEGPAGFLRGRHEHDAPLPPVPADAVGLGEDRGEFTSTRSETMDIDHRKVPASKCVPASSRNSKAKRAAKAAPLPEKDAPAVVPC